MKEAAIIFGVFGLIVVGLWFLIKADLEKTAVRASECINSGGQWVPISRNSFACVYTSPERGNAN